MLNTAAIDSFELPISRLDFVEFLIAVSMTSTKDPVRKTELFFSMYDIDRNGLIDENEMRCVVEVGSDSLSVAVNTRRNLIHRSLFIFIFYSQRKQIGFSSLLLGRNCFDISTHVCSLTT